MSNQTSTKDSSFSTDKKPDADAQGQAALLLLESLLHTLLDCGILDKTQAAEIFESACQVKEESAVEAKEPESTLRRSLGLLRNMQLSIAHHAGQYDPTAKKRR